MRSLSLYETIPQNMDEKVLEKLKILAESAKYDVSCASSGTSRSHKSGAIGSAADGVFAIVSLRTDGVSRF